MHVLLYSVLPTFQQATANPPLCQRLLDTNRQVEKATWTIKDELTRTVMPNMLLEISREITPER